MMNLSLLLAAPPAHAIPVTSTYCFQYQRLNDYSDHMVGQGSNFTTNTWDARGLRVVFDAASPEVRDADVRTETNDSAGNGNGLPGCVTVTLENTTTYTVRLYLDAVRGGNTVRLMVPSAVRSYDVKTSHVPVNGQTYGPGGGWSALLDDPESRVHAAANFAIGRWTLGVTNKIVDIDLDNTVCGPTSSCMEQSTGRIHISTTFGYDDTYNQFVVAHEVGHAMWRHRAGGVVWNKDSNAVAGSCGPDPDHAFNTKEYQSVAIFEGLAHFYAAMAFNSAGQSQACEYPGERLAVDWNRSGGVNILTKFDCGGAVLSPIGIPLTNATDYYGQYCSVADHRGVEFDWLRLLWQLRTNHGFERIDFETMVAGANPNTWIATTGNVTNDKPYERLKNALSNAVVAPATGSKRSTFSTQAAVHNVDQ
jgi:hypothetical protein